MTLDYDEGDQLLSAVLTPQGGNPVKGYNYGYDGMGNRTGYTYSGGSGAYQWDAEDRLVKITQFSTGNPQLDSGGHLCLP